MIFTFTLPSGTVLNDNASPSQSIAGAGQAHQQADVRRSPVPAEDEVDSLHGLGGYHGSIHVTDNVGTAHTIYYAVGVFSETRQDGTTNGIPVFQEVSLTTGNGKVPIQFQYSNAVHGPEGSIPNPH